MYGGGAARAGAGKARRVHISGHGVRQRGFPWCSGVRARLGRPVALGGAAPRSGRNSSRLLRFDRDFLQNFE
jgi:hypothetical protein